MGMKLRRGVTIHRAGSIVLKLGHDELACRLGGTIAADARLRVSFQLSQCDGHCLAVRGAHPIISANERSQRYGFRSGERCVPPGPMFDRRNGLTSLRLVFLNLAMADQL